MRKALILFLSLLLAVAAMPAFGEEEADFAPEATPAPASFDMDIPIDIPIDVPIDEAESEDDVFGYGGYTSSVSLTYETLTNNTYSLTMDRPSAWVQIPGRYTLCFQEAVMEGQTPARMALTRKTATKDLTDSRITSEIIAYLKVLAAQYDKFEVSNQSKETPFIGQMGYSAFYTAQKDTKVVRGYVVMAAIKRYLYVFHFSASESAFASYTDAMVHLRESVRVDIE